MTKKELNSVREVMKLIRECERRLADTVTLVNNLTPILDGMPHSMTITSKVEALTIKIADLKSELAALEAQLIQARADLTEKILSEFAEPCLQTLAILRYVEGLRWEQVAHRSHYCLRFVFKLNRKLNRALEGHLKKVLVCSNM